MVMPVTSPSPDEPPSIGFDELNHISDFHLTCWEQAVP